MRNDFYQKSIDILFDKFMEYDLLSLNFRVKKDHTFEPLIGKSALTVTTLNKGLKYHIIPQERDWLFQRTYSVGVYDKDNYSIGFIHRLRKNEVFYLVIDEEEFYL